MTLTTTPAWLDQTHRETDATDLWQEATDPCNEYGEVCTAHLMRTDVDCMDERHRCYTGSGFTLLGIAVQEGYGNGVKYYDRDEAAAILGTDAIWHIEAHEMECAA